MSHAQLPVFPIVQRAGVPCGIGAVPSASAAHREKLDHRDLPNAPGAPRPR